MSVENSESADGGEIEAKPVNGTQDQRLNGLSNGHIESSSSKHKSSSKDKYRDKDYKSSKSSSSSNREKESSDKHKSSSSSNKDKYRDKDRPKDKDKEREKDKDKERDKDKHKSSSSSHKTSSREKDRDKDKERSKDKEREKDRDKDREKDRDKDKDKQRDKEKSKEKSDRDNEKRDRDGDKDRKKEHKSSSSDKDRKDKEREKDKSESSSKDRDKDRDRQKSSKDKHSSSSSRSKDKDRDRDREKHPSSRDKDRSKDKEKRTKEEEVSPIVNEIREQQVDEEVKEVKKELEMPRNDYDQSCSGFSIKEETYIKTENQKYGYENKVEVKEDYSNFNISQASSCDYSMSQFRSDEPAFDVKAEMTDDSQDNVENETMEESAQDVEMREVKEEQVEDDDDDIPLAKRKAPVVEEDSDDDAPLVSRKKPKPEKIVKTEKKEKKAKRKKKEVEEEFLDEKPKKKKVKKEKVEPVIETESPTKGRKKKAEEDNQDVWRWWEEEKREDGVKWTFLEHKGPVFAPEYEPLPNNVKFYYDGKEMRLSQDAEEVACFYAKMLNHDYVTKKSFNDNFFKDWRKSMTSKEKDKIKDLSKCDFGEMHTYFQALSEKNKNRSKEEKLALKEANEKMIQEYGFCIIDGHREKIGNFKLEPPGLFRGRGEHPKMGLVKRRIMPEEVSINCSKDSKIPEPPKGHKWKEVRHDNTVTWLASWIENVQGQVKYIMLNPSSKLKGEKDFQKYETARRLDKHIDQIRSTYREEWKSKEMRIRQRGVALYFIDRLALRAGNEKDEDQADTVGCCSLRVEHVQLHKALNGKENVVVFDFLGKDSIRYYNEVEVEKRVFKNLELFMENKKEGDDLFDRLNTLVLNEHLRELMEGLTAKVFRTYNASITLQKQLDLLTDPDATIPEKLLAYNRANRAVAVLCNHQRSIPKSHAKSMENLKEKIRQKKDSIEEMQAELKDLQKQAKRGSVKERLNADKKAKQLDKLKEQLKKLELQETDRDENKTIALGTSKLNYLDPRISVAWCKKYKVPIEKIFNKTQRDKFRWAIHMADEDYRF